MKQHFRRSTFRDVGDKVFNFFGVFNIAGNNQPMRPSWQVKGLGIFNSNGHEYYSNAL